MAFSERLILGKELSQSVPSKADYIFREEPFGAVLFNKENLKQMYVDKRCLAMLESIDCKKSVAEILAEVSAKTSVPKIFLAALIPVYLQSLRQTGFVRIKADLPDFKTRELNMAPLVSAPNQISWLITNQCNLHCSHCGNTQKTGGEKEFSTGEWKRFIDQCAENKVFVFNISGGEPLLRKDLFELVRYARDKGIEVAMTTNATLISEKNINKIRGMDCFIIHFSLDGIGKVHDGFRNKPGLFKQVQKVVKLFKKHNLPFGITTAITKDNYADLENIKDFVVSNRIGSWEIYYAMPVGCLSREKSLSREQFLGLAKKASKIREELRGKANVFIGDSLGYFGSCRLRDEEWKGCHAGINHCAVEADGNVKGCPIQTPEFVEGNLREKTLKEIWNNKNAFSYNRKPRRLEGQCAECNYSEKCRGGCLVSMFSQGNKKLSENSFCIKAIEAVI